jgi:hypothetical protein
MLTIRVGQDYFRDILIEKIKQATLELAQPQ